MRNKGYKVLLAVFMYFLAGCQALPSKSGTTMDKMKATVKSGIAKNNNIGKTSLPKSVDNQLVEKFDSTNMLMKTAPKLPQQRFNVTAENTDAKTFFLGLVEGTDTNIIVHPKVEGSISLNVNNVTIEEVLEMVRKVYGFGYEKTNSGIKIYQAGLQTKTFKINYLQLNRSGSSSTKVSSSGLDGGSSSSGDSDDSSDSGTSDSSGGSQSSNINTQSDANFWEELRTSLRAIIGSQEGRKIAVNPMSGFVMVTAMPDELNKVAEFLQESEQSLNKQVILEAKILEVELNDGYRAGINWALITEHVNASQLGAALHGQEDNFDFSTTLPRASGATTLTSDLEAAGGAHIAPTIPVTSSSFGGILTLGMNFRKLATFVELLGSQGNVQVLSSPRVSTMNNQKALIKVGDDEFFVTNITTTTTTTNGVTTSSPTAEFEPFFTGIALDVTPQIDERNNVTLHVHPTISTVTTKNISVVFTSGTEQYPLAKSAIRETDTVIRAQSGETVVIGGLMRDKMEEATTGVPLLKDIPFFGKAFRQTRQRSRKSELVILLRPLVLPPNTWNDALEQTYQTLDSMDIGFHVGGNVGLYGSMAERSK